jgi:hypothetical protein
MMSLVAHNDLNLELVTSGLPLSTVDQQVMLQIQSPNALQTVTLRVTIIYTLALRNIFIWHFYLIF